MYDRLNFVTDLFEVKYFFFHQMAAGKKTTVRISTFLSWNPFISSRYRWPDCERI